MRFILILLLQFWGFAAFAQIVRVEGSVVDESNGAPIPFANVVVRGSGEGAVSDSRGKFSVMVDAKGAWLDVSFLGYERASVYVEPPVPEGFKVSLSSASEELNEVVLEAAEEELKKRENPAHRLLRGIWAARKEGRADAHEVYFYRYEKMAFSMVNLKLKLEGVMFLDPLRVIEDYIDTVDDQTILPMFLAESFYASEGNVHGEVKREKLLSNRTSGFDDNAGIEQFWEALYQPYNFNSNTIFLFKKNFISPVSQLGLLTYKYYLVDSLVADGRSHYTVAFIPQRKHELTFQGEFVVEDSTFDIVSYDMRASDGVNLNFVEQLALTYRTNRIQLRGGIASMEGLGAMGADVQLDSSSIQQVLEREQAGSFLDLADSASQRGVVSKSMRVMFKPVDSEKVPGVIGERTVSFYDYGPEPFSKGEEVSEGLPVDPADGDEMKRPEPLTERELGIIQMIDSLQHIRRFNTYVDWIAFIASGYYETSIGWDIGPLLQSVSYNDIEGFRFAFGGRTYRSRNDRVRLYLQGAYGLKDERWKGSTLLKGLMPFDYRFEWGVGYRFDLEQLGQRRSSKATQTNNALSSLLSRYPFDKLSMVQEYQAYIEPEIAPNLKIRLSAVHRSIYDAGNLNFSFRDPSSPLTIDPQNEISTTELSAEVRYEPGRKFINTGIDLLSVYTGNPSFKVVYTRALPNLLGANYDFHKVYFSYDQPINVPVFGRSIVLLEAGKTFGVVPYPLLDIAPGNPTYTYSRHQYNLMDFFEFVTDEYVGIHYEHHFLGAFLNKVPVVRKLQWREVVSFHGLIGTANPQSLQLHLDDEAEFAVPSSGYYEVSAGLENIFKFLRVEAVWRLSQRDLPNAIPFGVRVDVGINF